MSNNAQANIIKKLSNRISEGCSREMKQFADMKLSCYADVMEKGLTLNSHFYPWINERELSIPLVIDPNY